MTDPKKAEFNKNHYVSFLFLFFHPMLIGRWIFCNWNWEAWKAAFKIFAGAWTKEKMKQRTLLLEYALVTENLEKILVIRRQQVVITWPFLPSRSHQWLHVHVNELQIKISEVTKWFVIRDDLNNRTSYFYTKTIQFPIHSYSLNK